MKFKFLFLIFSVAFSANVKFNVDMSLQDVGSEGPTLWMGAFYPDPGFVMEDNDGDNIWSYTINLEPGSYTYKFRNGWWADWNTGSGWEEVPAECEFGQYGDREVIVTDQDMTIDTVCFNSCNAECNEVIYSNVTFQVDMTDENLAPDDIVYVQGTFNGWCGYCNPMTDLNNDGIWELTLEIPVGEYEYLFTTNGWDGLQGGATQGGSCDWLPTDTYANYGFNLTEQNLLLGPYCFGTCWETCQPPAPVDVTFHVDMSSEEVNGDVYMIGNFQTIPWQTLLLPTIMVDEDGDGVYSATISVSSDDLVEYKFVNGSQVEDDSGIGVCGNNSDSSCTSPGSDCNNREFQVPSCELNDNGECTLEAIDAGNFVFNSCDLISTAVNFTIDLNDWEYPNADYDQCGLNGSWNADGDNWLGWGLTLTDDDGDGVFQGSLDGLTSGAYEYIVFCSGVADNYSGWGVSLGAPLGSECDGDPSDEFPNYGFTVGENDLDVNVCAGSCDSECSGNGGGDDTPTYTVTFDIDGVEDCGFVSVTGTFDNWSGWGANTDTNMQAEIADGSYEFAILCVDNTADGWYNDIWGNSVMIDAPLYSECDVVQNGENPNYGFTVNGSDLTVSYCAGTCDTTCLAECDPYLMCAEVLTCFGDQLYPTSCGPENCDEPLLDTEGICAPNEHTVTFDIDGVEDCGFVSVTGTFDNWSGWGATSDTNMQAEIADGSYEFVILCVDNTNDGWWNDIWSNSEMLGAPVYSECDVVQNGENSNYGFTVSGSDLTVEYCAGSCDATCSTNGDCSSIIGDVNLDNVINVVDVVALVGHILGTSPLTSICEADTNDDGILNVVDVVALVGIILGD